MNQQMTALIAALLLPMFSGCGHSFHVEIDAYATNANTSSRTYVLISSDKNVMPGNIQYREFSRFVKRSLLAKGFTEVDSADTADISIDMLYGISDPIERLVISSNPEYGQIGVKENQLLGQYGFDTPVYGVTGYSTDSHTEVSYIRHLTLVAYDLIIYRNSQRFVQLWKTTATSRGSSGDLRRVFPILVAASQEYLNADTGQKVKVMLRESDERVLAIKGEAASSKNTD